jgi:hypothetical protein
MAAPSASITTNPPPIGRSPLRIVLFGMPDAGKSSLLGALVQAGQTQEHLLNGQLMDLPPGLIELQRRLYEGTPRETLEEVVPFPIAFKPFRKTPAAESDEQINSILVDCDGRVANEVLSRKRSLNSNRGDGTLAQAIVDADALILAIDASAPANQVNADFTEFARFLRLLEQERGHRTEIGGQPVFLVLTKCDLLAKPGDATADWIRHIGERQSEVEHRFRDFLAGQSKDGKAIPPGGTAKAFGRIDLHPWATAVKRPALADSPPRPREPFSVAELFRQCLQVADQFQRRRQHSSHRLFWTVASTVALLLGLGALAAFLISNRLEAQGRLESRVDRFQVREQERTPALWHRFLQGDLDELALLANDPGFPRLPDAKKEYVQGRLKELTAYREYEKSLDQIGDPKNARSEEQLKKIENKLHELAGPDDYDWHLTEACRRRDNWIQDCHDLYDAVARITKEYEELIQKGQAVLDKQNEANLPKRAKQVLDLARTYPDPERDKSVKDRAVKESSRVTYGVVFGNANVDRVYEQWKNTRKKLEGFASLENP